MYSLHRRFVCLLALVFISSILITGCSDDDMMPTPPHPAPTVELSKIEIILDGDNQELIDLLNKVRGSVGKTGPGSKVIWSRKNDYGLGLYISANHVVGLDTWDSRNAEFLENFTTVWGNFGNSQLPPTNGNVQLDDTLSADFALMHFDISASATNTTILPKEDFYLGIMDNQKVERDPLFPQYPDELQINTPLAMYDPESRTKADGTWSNPVAGENALLVGYPQDAATYPNGAVAYGLILSDDLAETKIMELQSAGDSEGDIPYDPTVEFFVDAQGIAGMSGGGVFNAEGQLLGIMVRASDTENAPKIVRVVKVSHIRSKMLELYNSLSQTDKDKLKPYISGEL